MSETYTEKAIRNTIYLFLTWVFQTGLGMLYWIFLAKYFPQEEIGKFSVIYNFAFILSVFINLGLGSASTKLISENPNKERSKKYNTILFLIINVSTFTLFLIFLFFGNFISALISIEKKYLFFSLFLAYLISLSYSIGSTIYALSDMRSHFFVNAIYSLIKLIFLLPILILSPSYILIYFSFLFSTFITVIHRIAITGITTKIKEIEWRRFFSLGFVSILVIISYTFFERWGVLITNKFYSLSLVAIFTIAMTISNIFKAIPSIFSSAILPLLSETWSKNRKEKSKNMIQYSLKYSYIATIPLIILFSVFPKEILIILSNYSYVKGADTLRLLVLAFTILGIANMISQFFYFIGMEKIHGKIQVLEAIILLFFTLLLYRYGFEYIALSYLITSIISFILVYFQIKKKIKIGMNLKNLLKILLSSLIPLPIIFIFKTYAKSYLGAITSAFIYFVLYGLLLVLMKIFDKKDKEIIEKIFENFGINLKKYKIWNITENIFL